jgi:hypothetical protein
MRDSERGEERVEMLVWLLWRGGQGRPLWNGEGKEPAMQCSAGRAFPVE